MFLKRKTVSVIVILVLSFGIAIGVTARGTLTNITAQLNGSIKFKLNGNDYTPANSDGTKLDPISYNGRTYLPLRSIADALKVAVDWDAGSNTVFIGDKESKGINAFTIDSIDADWIDVTKTTDKNIITFKGGDTPVTFNNAYYAVHDGAVTDTGRINFNVDGKYSKITFSAWIAEGNGKVIIKDAESNIELKTLNLSSTNITDVDLDIKGVKKLQIYIAISYGKIVIANPLLK